METRARAPHCSLRPSFLAPYGQPHTAHCLLLLEPHKKDWRCALLRWQCLRFCHHSSSCRPSCDLQRQSPPKTVCR
jgi:hypothetical protein